MESQLYDPQAEYAIGVDIGGTKINAGVVSAEGAVLHTVSLSTLAGQAKTVDRVHQAVVDLMAVVKEKFSSVRLKGIGVGSAGQIDWANGSIRSASELIPGYAGTALKCILQKQFLLPVIVDNDVNVLALTEKYVGAAQGVNHFLCLALGTGVGGAIVVDGRLVHGFWGGGGELGHLSVDFKGPSCLCGGKGCLEQYASGTSIARRMREKLALSGHPAEDLDSREVITRWKAGDPLAVELMEETIAALGSAVASLIHMFNPEVIVIGGGVAEAGEPLFEGIRREVNRRSMPSMLEGVRIEAAYRGNLCGMIGAALQVWEYGE
ncbi:ROK family protein [Paenibacillus sp. LHD-38]|uniref:ROK family protein n=1 Tax=Paenibacillus sp. LHD-38 TaxID=3072143 RepID=UPI00280C9B6B|nr:ROK family protein [Paenibacillus sp. LHD-38]MDQ8735173.1 ROK family protein [Paenibacillus sp. LHD-38]